MVKHIVVSVAAAALLIALPYAFAPNLAESPAPPVAPTDCPLPSDEGETWIARRWIVRGELQVECTHVAGFPRFDWPTAVKVGLIK